MTFFESSSCWVEDSGNAANPARMPPIMKTNETIDQITPQHCEEPPYLCAKTLASDSFTFLRIRSSHYSGQYNLVEGNLDKLTISQTLYRDDITPMNNTTYFNGSACLINQQATSNPTAIKIVTIVSQSFRAHHSVSRKHTPSTRLAILLATISKPQNMRRAPMSEEPR
jgi:hypothetical protein